VRGALAEIPFEQRMVLELAHFDVSRTESRAPISVRTAKTRIRLGMMKLREVLAPIVSNGGVF
jgi:DNA-directed RNA polymerase specialized sigma24 family protein